MPPKKGLHQQPALGSGRIPGETWQWEQDWPPLAWYSQSLKSDRARWGTAALPNLGPLLSRIGPISPSCLPSPPEWGQYGHPAPRPPEHGAITSTRDVQIWSCFPLRGVRVLSKRILRSSELLSPQLSPYGFRAPRLMRDGTMLTSANQWALST